MSFPNAYQGVKKLFTSEILNIISGICLAIAAISAAVMGAGAMSAENANAITDGQAAAVLGGGIAATIFLVAGVIIALIAYILMIVGIGKGMKDEPAFKTAFIFVFVGLACNLVGSFIPGTFGSILKSLGQICTLIVFIFIILAIKNLALKLNDESVVKTGNTILYILVVIYVLTFIASIVSIWAVGVASVLAIIAAVLNVISYIIFLVYLSKAKKMLA
ncbi:MAG: hypothetical protein IJH40_08530 [Ruminococcus sp.]|uniref:hypothetical protein n=1 Tax=Ruminococcus sp. TaxID=41978 RepID=UPI002873AE13|nr:hypothetical protein [Ruminococcus sp.]MBQ3285671.1 hypothetical protein [Ruminococcus sp.]